MQFDAQSDASAGELSAFKEWLITETASGLLRCQNSEESLRGAVFLFLNRAYEAHLDPDLICDLFASALAHAALDQSRESIVLHLYEQIDPVIERVYADSSP